ncbi:unnamed protein product [Parajaminaea phylloscopi]
MIAASTRAASVRTALQGAGARRGLAGCRPSSSQVSSGSHNPRRSQLAVTTRHPTAPAAPTALARCPPIRHLHSSRASQAATIRKPYLLADVGEGITECEVVKWHVAPGATVAEFDPLAEVQSDKASVEISSRFDGVVRELACDVGGIVKVGSPLCYIEMAAEEGIGGASETGGENLTSDAPPSSSPSSPSSVEGREERPNNDISRDTQLETNVGGFRGLERTSSPSPPHLRGLATPAVRRMCREHSLDVNDIRGTGKDGRVTKEDVMRHMDGTANAPQAAASSPLEDALLRGADVPGELGLTADNVHTHAAAAAAAATKAPSAGPGSRSSSPHAAAALAARKIRMEPAGWTDPQPLAGIRKAMFKSLSQSASIPVFTFAEEIDVTELESLRQQVNQDLASSPEDGSVGVRKTTLLPFLVKAMSVALHEHPLFLCRVQVPAGQSSASLAEQAAAARLVPRRSHDVSIALSTTAGLLTPTLRSVQSSSVFSIASRIAELQAKGSAGPLSADDLGDGGTVTLSNIGSVGGGLLGTVPVLPPTGQLTIGALGRIVDQPRYADTLPGASAVGGDVLVRRKVLPVTFAADHRVLQGTELAALVMTWKRLCERPGTWLAKMV